MAYWYRDALAVLRGLRGVANAYYGEVSSELQHVVTNSSLRPLAGVLYESVTTITDKVQELQGGGNACDGELNWDTFGEDSFRFTGLTEHMPLPSKGPDPPATPTEEGVLANGSSGDVSGTNALHSTDAGSKPTDVATAASHRRRYHSLAYACSVRTFHTPIRHIHTTVVFGNDTVIGSTAHSTGSRSEKDSDSSTRSNHDQKV